MNKFLQSSRYAVALLAVAALSGCGMTSASNGNAVSDATVPSFTGVLHGGPNPVVGSRVVMYVTNSGGYGAAATALQEANQMGTAAHQDTDAGGNFSFPGGVTCPAGQYAYVVSYGGNTGANANNPNSILMTVLGPCNSLYSGTTYNGSNIFINELTTVAAGYALGNFMTVTGSSIAGFTVNINAPATNSATTGTVTPGATVTYASPGLRDAFQNALSLVPYSGGVANTTTATNAAVPTVLINTLGNVLQACVNSVGGGTDATGLPTSSTTTNDGTNCGKLFAFTSYSVTAATGPTTGTMTNVIPTNTLSAVMSLAKRPTSNTTLWNAGCTAAGGTGTTTGVTCIYNLSSPFPFYQAALSAAPPDYVMGLSYPKGSFGVAAVATCGPAATPVAFTTDALYYPWNVAMDVDDNVVILNEDTSSGTCYSVITAKNDGTPIGGSQWIQLVGASSATNARWLSTDAFGHAIVPSGILGTVNIFAAGPADTNIAAPVSVPFTSTPTFSAVDNLGNAYVGGQGAGGTGTASNLQLMSVTNTSHASPAYSIAALGTTGVTAKMSQMTLDINSNVFMNSSSGTASSVYAYSPGATSFATKSGIAGSTSNGVNVAPDIYGNNWTIVQNTGATANVLYQTAYTGTGTTFALGTPATSAALTVSPTNVKLGAGGAMDGSNVFWYVDPGTGASGVSGFLRGFDTMNTYAYPQLFGCRVTAGQTTCGNQGSTSSTPFLFYATRGVTVDAAGSIWVVNGTQGQLNQVIGLGAPTLPLFIHDAASMKP